MKKITLSLFVAICISVFGCSSKQTVSPQQTQTSNVIQTSNVSDAGAGGGQNGIAVGNPPKK